MKKSTIYLLVAAAVLAIVTVLATSKSDPPPPKKIDVAGYAKPEELEAERARGLMETPLEIVHPVDEILIERDAAHPTGPTLIHLVKSGSGKDAVWRMKAPVDAPAVRYTVERIVEVFKTPTASKYSRAIKDNDLARYDFEPARRVRVTLKSQGTVWNGVDLVVGRVEKGEASPAGEAQADTWVMRADDPTTAYLLAGKDLRTPAEAELSALRDKKVFSFEADDVSKVTITPPGGQKAVLVGTRSETPPAPGEDGTVPPDAKPTVKVDWALVEPAGVVGDQSIASYAKSLANLRVNDFVPVAKASDEAKAALSGPTWKIEIEVKPGGAEPAQVHVVNVEAGGGDVVWGQVEGKDELLSLQSFSGKNLRKGLDELANKVVFDVVPEDVVELTLKSDAGPLTLVHGTPSWSFKSPAVAYPADPSTLMKQLAKLTAVRWARDDEIATARAALAAPDIEARLVTKDGVERVVRFGPAPEGDGDKHRWGVVGDAATAKPFLVQDFNAKRWVSDVGALRMKKLLVAKKDDIQRVELTIDGITTVLEKPAPGGGSGGELVVVPLADGKKTKEDAARTLAATLAALDAKSFHDGKPALETGLDPAQAKRVVVTLADGTKTTLFVSAKPAGEGEVYAVVDTGPLAGVVVGINEYQAKNIVKKPDDFIEDAGAGPGEPPLP